MAPGPIRACLVLALLLSMTLGCQRAAYRGPLRPITVACTSQPQGTLVHVALAKGYFEEEGLKAEAQLHTYGKAALQSLLEHKADFATVAETPVMFNAAKGEAFCVIAIIEASNKNNAILARRDAGIAAPSDLPGKRIAFTPGTTSDFFLDSMLTAHGLTRGTIQAIAMKPEEMREAILGRKVDAVCTWNFPLTLIKRDLGANGVVFFDREIYTETFNLAASKAFVEADPETVKQFLRAMLKAETFVAKHPEEAKVIVATATHTDLQLVREVWDAFHYVVRLDQTLLITLEDETRWAMKRGLTDLKTMPDYRKVIHEDSLRSVRPESVKTAL
jgi:NitT/TauT family transport system substrate-binding protein